MPVISVETPLGWISLTEEAGAITALGWDGRGSDRTPLLDKAARQLLEYFAHGRETFDLPLRPGGGAFQQSVNDAMRAIPYGQTREYGAIARELNAPAQAVGQACGGNTIAILIPCHRVVGASSLGGFSAPGGVETKVALLRHEGAYGLLI